MRRGLPIAITVITGLFALVALFLRGLIGSYLPYVLDLAILLMAAGVLMALAFLIIKQVNKIRQAPVKSVPSMVLVLAFAVTLVAGLVFGVENPVYNRWVSAIQSPLQASLLGLSALVMSSAALKLFRRKGIDSLSVSFTLSAVFFLLLGMNISHLVINPQLDVVLLTLSQLPLIGARGLLIGISLGALLVALRIVFGIERPFDER
jgi:cytochrome bd-type quinol oxidase subunit 2